MKTLTIRDFHTRPRAAQLALARNGVAILTTSGRPVAVLLAVDGDELDETLLLIRRVRAMRAAVVLRKAARIAGTHRAGAAVIAREICAARTARRRDT